MSHLIINQNELISQFGEDAELKELILHFESEYKKIGEVVCKIKVNELPLTEDQELKLASTQVKHIDSFELETENTNLLLIDVLEKWKEEIPQLILSADSTAQKIRFKGIEHAYISFSQFIDACHLLVSSLSSIRTLIENEGTLNLYNWQESEKKLWTIFNDLMEACNSKNNNVIADIIEYDLADTLQRWLDLLSLIHKN